MKPKTRVYDDEGRNKAFLNKNKKEFNDGLKRVEKFKNETLRKAEEDIEMGRFMTIWGNNKADRKTETNRKS